MFTLRTILVSLALAVPALAQVTPTSPDSNTVVKVGEDIHALWTADASGQWTDLEIQLMTGDNFQMVPLATLASGVDGTTTSSLDLPCPDVSPYSKIYFLQFTRAGNVSTATWTTRFTITGADGSSVAPTQETNNVQWGTGVLVGNASTVAGAESGTNATSSTSTNLTSSSNTPLASASSTSTIASSASASDASNSTSTSTSSTSARASGASAAPAAASSTGAALRKSTVGLGAVVLGLAAAVAL